MTAAELVTILTPLVVYGVIELVKLATAKIPGWVIVSIGVPLLSAAVTYVSTLLTGATAFWQQFAFGFLAVFVSELIKQLKRIGTA
jgi:hypothetical protein